MKEIQLTRGYSAIVDDEDYSRVSAHKWCVMITVRADGTTRAYAIRNARKPNGRRETQLLHRFLLDAPVGMNVDHINGDPLDNRRGNMRICTRSENTRNQRPRSGGTSKFKGVYWNKDSKKWRAQIKGNGRMKPLGYFASELDAAHAYDAAALESYGDFARINTYGETDYAR